MTTARSAGRARVAALLFVLAIHPWPALAQVRQGMAEAQTDLLAEAADDNFGWSLANAGDVNSDGVPDLIVGAIYSDSGGKDAGKAYVYSGGSVLSTTPLATMTGTSANEQFGVSVAGAGDVNGDGYDDVIVGARLNDLNGSAAGAAFIYFGGLAMDGVPDVVLRGEFANDWFGNSVASAGDMNHDGYADVIVGAPYNDRGGSAAGAAYVYLGGPAMNAIPDAILVGEIHDDQFGWSVSGAGDFNRDGYSDVIIGARLHCVDQTLCTGTAYSRGRAYLYLGGAVLHTTPDVVLDGDAADDWFGNTVAGIGDINGDGYSDVAVGAIYADPVSGGSALSAAGTTNVYLGGASPNSARDILVPGEQADSQSGWAIASAGDVDGDGRSDFWTTAHFFNDGPTLGAGKISLIGGRTPPPAAPLATFFGEGSNVQLGQSVAGADVTGSGGLADGILGEVYSRDVGLGSGKSIVASPFCLDLRADQTSLSWTSCSPFAVYEVYRGDIHFGSGGTGDAFCLVSEVTGPSTPIDPDPPLTGNAFFYLVTGRRGSIEGALGFNSKGDIRPNTAPCP